MADGIFNIARGSIAEKIRDGASAVGILLLQANEAESSLVDHDTVASLLTANTEANFTNYQRKTGITATLTVDDVNDKASVDIPDQTWASAGGATNNTLTKLIVFYDEGGTDATRVPLLHFDFAVTTDGTDLTAKVNAAGLWSSP